MSELAIKLINEAYEKQSTFLDLGCCGLTEIPEEIAKLKGCLQHLNLGRWFWSNGQYVKTENGIGDNNFYNTPTSLSVLSQLQNITILSLYGTGLDAEAAEYISRLTSLSSLDLRENIIGDRGAEYIGRLSSLSSLELKYNRIGDKGAEYISRLSSLTSLGLDYNNVGDRGVKHFNRLSSLTSLSLDHNSIGDQGAEYISRLYSLTYLNLRFNHIGDRGAAYFSQLLLLSYLNLSKNNITTFMLADSNTIKTLHLEENWIEQLTLNLVKYIQLEIEFEDAHIFAEGKLFLRGNPIKNIPPEVMRKGRVAILEYLEGNLRPLNECKLIFVGDGAVGKTSLMKRLVYGSFNQGEGTTHGINKIAWNGIENSQGELIKLNLWDFGGQHIQHSLHQFFFTKRVVYVLVLNPRNDEKAAYWLDQVDKLGFGSQLIIVYNWIDRRDIEADWSKNFKELRKTYKYLPDPILLSCKEGEGMDVFRERVKAVVLTNEGLKTEYPKTWFNIKQKLENGIPIEKNYIEYHEYEALCAKEQYNDPERRHTLLKILDSVGAIVFFDKPVLNNLQVLNPEWISTGAYAILTSQITQQKKGHLTWTDLQAIFSTEKEIFSNKNIKITYTQGQFNFILQLMLDYRLCQLNPLKEHEYLIPTAFGEKPHKEYDTAGGRHYRLKFQSAFEMLVIHRFIAKNIVHIQSEDYWHSGIYFKHATSNTWALVETNQYSQEINCWIKGDNIRGLWEVIRNDFREIFNMYYKLPVEEEVEYTYDGCSVFLKYNQMIAALRKGVQVIQYDPATELENIDVLSVLELFETPKDNIRGMSNEQPKPEAAPVINVNPVINVSPQFTNNPQITASPTITSSPVQKVTAAETASPKDQPKPTTHDVAAEDKKVRQWKNKAVITATCSFIVTAILVLVWVKNWWLDATQWKWFNDHDLVKWIGGVLAFVWNSFIAKALYDRFHDPAKTKAYRESLRQ